MELTPDLQFKHYTLREVQLPADALVSLGAVDFDAGSVCCDLEHHVLNADHTEPTVVEALLASHWFDRREWSARVGGAA